MNNKTKRIILFLFGCIVIRILLIYVAYYYKKILPYMGIFALLIGISFYYLYLTDSRKTGIEVFGDKIWWNNLRPIHGILYILFGIFALYKNKSAWIFLFIDLIIGLTAFINYHFIC